MAGTQLGRGAAGMHLVPAALPPRPAHEGVANGLPDFMDRALGWVHEHLDLFSPLDQSPLIDPVALKATAELALACSSLVNTGLRDPRLDDMVGACEDTARAVEFRRAVQDFPHLMQLFAPIVCGLLRCGLDDPELYDLTLLLQETYDQGYVPAVERTPSQTMDLAYALDRCQVRHGFPGMRSLLEHSIVGKQPPVGYLTDRDVYDMTHVLFAICDMGLVAPPPLPAEVLSWSRWATSALLNEYVRERDWDLVGELLLVCRCLGFVPEPIFSRAWRALCGAQADDGSVPDTSYSLGRASTRSGHDRRAYEFASNYHPTIVALEAAALTRD
jgi:hypothetical protein